MKEILLFLTMLMGAIFAYHSSLDTNVFYTLYPALFAGSAPLVAPLQLRWIAIQSELRMEVLCAYHPTCKSKYFKGALKRPVSENTPYNRNVAVTYAARRLIIDQSPWAKPDIDNIFFNVLQLNDTQSRDIATPAGLGNFIADKIISERHQDGCNQLGDRYNMDSRRRLKYPVVNFTDYTGYVPVNTWNQLNDPDRWQPDIALDSKFRVVSQLYFLPQIQYLKTWGINITNYHVAPQDDLWSENRSKYVAKTNYMINIQKDLTERQKMVAEFFDNKLKSLNIMGEFLVKKFLGGTLDNHTIFNFIVNGAIHESMAFSWKIKTKTDAVRPFTAIHFLKGDQIIQGWGGPGKGIVNMRGREWRSFLKVDSFSDYISGTSAVCSAWGSAARNLIGTDVIDFSYTFTRGSSVIEPNVTPSQDLTITYHTLTEMMEDCKMSRVWGGVHFYQAVEESRKVGLLIGRDFHNTAMRALQGL